MTIQKTTITALLLSTMSFYSCGGGDAADPLIDLRADNTRCVDVTQETTVTVKPVDMLFVVDNSGSMCPDQEALGQGMTNLANSLATLGISDLHMGIVTTDMSNSAQSGKLQMLENGDLFTTDASPASIDAIKDTFIDDPLDGADRFIGCTGIGTERGGDAALKAVTTLASGFNAGFLRDEANLVIVVITDEDDSSTNTAHDIAAGLAGAKNSAYEVFFHIIGHVTPDTNPLTPAQGDTCYNNDQDVLATDYFNLQNELQLLRPDDNYLGSGVDICMPQNYPESLESIIQEGSDFHAITTVDLKPFNFIPALSTLEVTADGQAVGQNDYSYDHDTNTITLLGAALLQPDVSIRVCGVPEDLGEI